MSEPNTNAIPSVRQRTQVKTLTSLAMLTAIAYVMMYLKIGRASCRERV